MWIDRSHLPTRLAQTNHKQRVRRKRVLLTIRDESLRHRYLELADVFFKLS